jgi:hypothetical protein
MREQVVSSNGANDKNIFIEASARLKIAWLLFLTDELLVKAALPAIAASECLKRGRVRDR